MTAKSSFIGLFPYFCLVLIVIIVLVNNNKSQEDDNKSNSMRGFEEKKKNRALLNREQAPEFANEEEYIDYLSKKLIPQHLNVYSTNVTTNKTALQHHQLLHLHHMKTAGTSMDGLIHCAIDRLRKTELENSIAYMNIHECSASRYTNCRDGKDAVCRNRINGSAILSYCAPLMDLETFGWTREESYSVDDEDEEDGSIDFSVPNSKPHAVTVLRHPVNRIWSMFRFKTKSCYKCTPLIDVYKAIDANETSDITTNKGCLKQLVNHQTHNLVSSKDGYEDMPEHELLEDAIHNMKHFFTMVGLTEEMNQTAAMVGKVFPWMAESIPGSDKRCPMPHRNASPRNNRCGENHTHWELPAHPDEETTAAIIAHNALDIKLYEQAVQQFELQRKALAMDQLDSE